jgi:hypothetical protein
MHRLLISLVLLLITAPATAGYTIFTRDLVSPASITVPGLIGPETWNNPGVPPVYPGTFGRMICRAPAFSLYSSNDANRAEVWSDSAGTATAAQVLAVCTDLRSKVAEEIKTIRKQSLDRIATDSSGVLAVYDENYRAALALTDGDTSWLSKDGKNAETYLAAFGSRLGMTPPQFAAWIVAENRRIGAAASRVEDEYLRLAYSVVPTLTDIDQLLALPQQYREFCGS